MLLGNHAATFDPLIMAAAVRRPVHFMASEQLFRDPKVGPWVRRVHAFPKAKYARDKAAIDKVLEHNRAGRAVGLFPEGNRSWTGQPQPLRPGLGWLLKKLDGPVVFVRNYTGWLAQPRWATYPRYVPFQLELSEPVTFPEDWTTAQIEEEVSKRLAFDATEVEVEGFTWGYKLAHGLPDFLWACPACFALDSLRVDPKDDDGVDCEACGSAWRLDVRTRLHAVRGEAQDTSVGAAAEALYEHFGALPTVDADAFVETGVALEEPKMRVFSVDDQTLSLESEGAAALRADGLYVGEWSLPFKQVKAVSIEIGDALQLRTADALFQLETDSPLKWQHFLAAHQAAANTARRGRRR